MSFFDKIQQNVFAITTKAFGDTCTWTPLDNSAPQTAQVLYQDPTAKHQIDQNDFSISRFIMEYKKGDLPGLEDSVKRAKNEKIKIVFVNGDEQAFWVKRCERVFDGKTIKAYLQPA